MCVSDYPPDFRHIFFFFKKNIYPLLILYQATHLRGSETEVLAHGP